MQRRVAGCDAQRPKPNWNETVPPISASTKKIEALASALMEFNSEIGRLNGRFGAEQ
jgi:hypothetical protein